LMGSSIGAYLVAEASVSCPKIGGVILISWPGYEDSSERSWCSTFPIFEFHGQQDASCSPSRSRKLVQKFFKSNGTFKPQWRTFREEGHFFFHTTSSAYVYSTVLKLMEAEKRSPQ